MQGGAKTEPRFHPADLPKRIATGQRRLDHLKEIVATGKLHDRPVSPGSLAFHREEIPYHEAALQALKLWYADLHGEDTAAVMLCEAVQQIEELLEKASALKPADRDDAAALIDRAKVVLRRME